MMRSESEVVLAWVATVLMSSLPWLIVWRPQFVPAAAAVAIVIEAPWKILGHHAPSRASVMVLAAAAAIVATAGWRVLGAWLVLGGATWAAGFSLGRGTRPRPDFADVLMMAGWGGAFVVFPRILVSTSGGWVAPLVLLLGARRLGTLVAAGRVEVARLPAPPGNEIRGDLFLEGAVLAGRDGLRASLPIDLTVEPGESISILCDDPVEAGALARMFAGRSSPADGDILAGGHPIAEVAGAVALIAPGESFVPGSLDENVSAMCAAPLSRGERAAVEEACSLGDVRRLLEGRTIAADGAPLSRFHRMLILAARVIPSHDSIVVVEDPQPWVNSIRGEIWRSAVVRASVGRTSIWITPDRQLAARADRHFHWRQATLRPVKGEGA